MPQSRFDVAIFIPCYNEELTVATVVREARQALPDARIYVFDNNSSDLTVERAREAGAEVISSRRQGKGNVVRHAFETIDADILVMTDGDATYPMSDLPKLIQFIKDGHDMAVGTRLNHFSDKAFRNFHLFGNRALSGLVGFFFGHQITDMLSGYRAFSGAFASEVPLISEGFEIETDLTLQAISKGYSIVEMPIEYRERPEGSFSKLQTYGDGFLIIKFILRLVRDYRPLPFFSSLAAFFTVMGLLSGWAPIKDYVLHAYVYTVPRAILAAACILLAVVLFGVGLILDSQNRHFAEQFAMARLQSRRQKALRIKS